MKKIGKIIKMAIVPAALSAVLVGCSEAKDPKVATVNDVEIKESELNAALQNMYGTEVLDDLMSNELIKQEAKKQGIKVTEDELNNEYETYAEYYGGEDALLESLKTYNMTKKDILKDLKTYLFTMKLMEKEITLTEEEIKQYYEENKENYLSDEDEQLAFEDVKSDVEADLMKDRIDEGYDDWVDGLFEESEVKTYLFK